MRVASRARMFANGWNNSNTSAHNTWQLALVLEELFTNSMKHGYPGLNVTASERL